MAVVTLDEATILKAVERACYVYIGDRERWARVREQGITDNELLALLRDRWSGHPGGCGPDQPSWSCSPEPSIVIGKSPGCQPRNNKAVDDIYWVQSEPMPVSRDDYRVLRGRELLSMVRRAMGVGLPAPEGQMALFER